MVRMFARCGAVKRPPLLGLAAAMLLVAPVSSQAAETVTYTYDALGRLTQSNSSGSVNAGLVAASTYDAAGNRTNYAVSGSSNSSAPSGSVIVLPLAGFTIIPLPAVIN